MGTFTPGTADEAWMARPAAALVDQHGLPALQVGGHRGKADGKLLDGHVTRHGVDPACQLVAAHDAAGTQGEVHERRHLHVQGGGLDLFKIHAACVSRPHDGAGRGADHDVGPDAGFFQRAQGAHMRESPQAAAAQHQRHGGAAGVD
jgi:hypothetical protein